MNSPLEGLGSKRSYENQRYRASVLNLVAAAITVYLERAVQALRDSGKKIDDELLKHLSPLRWEHINLLGDYMEPKQTRRTRPF
jgi:hypothetical protein